MDKYNSYTPEKMQEFYNRGVELRQKYECWDDCCYNEIFRDEDVFRMACAGFYGDEIDFTVKEWYIIGEPCCDDYGQ